MAFRIVQQSIFSEQKKILCELSVPWIEKPYTRAHIYVCIIIMYNPISNEFSMVCYCIVYRLTINAVLQTIFWCFFLSCALSKRARTSFKLRSSCILSHVKTLYWQQQQQRKQKKEQKQNKTYMTFA